MKLNDVLCIEEGFRAKPYLCSEGYVTVGIGTKLHKKEGLNPKDFPIKVSIGIAAEWLRSETKIKEERLNKSRWGEVYRGLDRDRQIIIESMAYQMGVSRLLKFHNTWGYLKDGDYEKAAEEMLDSQWARQTPKRARRHSQVMRSGSINKVYHSLTMRYKV